MEPATSQIIAEPELFPPELCRCGNCGYRLGGMPQLGQCPECGAQFDRSEVVMVGLPAGPNRVWWLQVPGMFAMLFLFMAAYIVEGNARLAVFSVRLAAFGLIGAILAVSVFRFIRRRASWRQFEVVVRITPRGIGFSPTPAAQASIKLTRWFHVTLIRLIPKRNGRLWIWVRVGDLDLFDALVECPAEAIPQLNECVRRWFVI
jgi:hypothetical protein